jgi:hypothetical protein
MAESVESRLQVELEALPEAVATSAMAQVALQLAARLDDGSVGDDARVRLSRELRLVTAELYRRADAGGDIDDVERFLERIATPAFRHP